MHSQAAKHEEARKRGKADFYTTDPKFDERFQLGYQMKGEQVRVLFSGCYGMAPIADAIRALSLQSLWPRACGCATHLCSLYAFHVAQNWFAQH